MIESTNRPASPLWASLAFTFTNSFGTGMATQGVYFVTSRVYGFDSTENYLLALLFGLTYIPAALFIGPAIRRLAHRRAWLSSRLVLALMMVFLGLLGLLPPVAHGVSPELGRASVWLFILLYAPANGALWPIVEAYVPGGRRGRPLRAATGRFNLSWSASVGVCLFAIAPLFATGGAHDADAGSRPILAFALLGVAHLGSLALLPAFTPEPGTHLHDDPEPHTNADEALLAAFRVLLPTSFLVIAILEPYLPTAVARLGLPPGWETPAAATWMGARFLAFLVMERWHAWHGRWSLPAIASVTMLAGLALALAAPPLLPVSAGVPTLLAGLALLGFSLGSIYAGAFYYAMHVGAAEIDAGGKHEALIGIGYAFGPLLGLGAALAAGGRDDAETLLPALLVGAAVLIVGVVTAVSLTTARRHARRDH